MRCLLLPSGFDNGARSDTVKSLGLNGLDDSFMLASAFWSILQGSYILTPLQHCFFDMLPIANQNEIETWCGGN